MCDKFISIRDNWHDYWDDFEEVKILCSESEIYGAILVKGDYGEPILASIAKMNKEGELELL